MGKYLLNKKVLFIGDKIYDYHIQITKAIEEVGAKVHFFSVEKKIFGI
jgi:hypothetical protein